MSTTPRRLTGTAPTRRSSRCSPRGRPPRGSPTTPPPASSTARWPCPAAPATSTAPRWPAPTATCGRGRSCTRWGPTAPTPSWATSRSGAGPPSTDMLVETVIIGAGQAGLALSRHLTAAGHGHVVLEGGRVGERWRSERWDSLRLLTPNWLNRLPYAAPLPDPDGFLDREGVIAHLEAYAAEAPVHEGTTVTRVARTRHGSHVATARGDWAAVNVVVAPGDCGEPRVPDAAAGAPPRLHQLPATGYRRPEQLPA